MKDIKGFLIYHHSKMGPVLITTTPAEEYAKGYVMVVLAQKDNKGGGIRIRVKRKNLEAR